MPVIPAFRRCRREYQKFKVNLGYTVSLKSSDLSKQ